MKTRFFDLDVMDVNQDGAEILYNDFLHKFVVLASGGVDGIRSDPPGGAASGAAYIVGSNAIDDFAGHENEIAYLVDATWRFIVPVVGMTMWVRDISGRRYWNGSAWVLSAD